MYVCIYIYVEICICNVRSSSLTATRWGGKSKLGKLADPKHLSKALGTEISENHGYVI